MRAKRDFTLVKFIENRLDKTEKLLAIEGILLSLWIGFATKTYKIIWNSINRSSQKNLYSFKIVIFEKDLKTKRDGNNCRQKICYYRKGNALE